VRESVTDAEVRDAIAKAREAVLSNRQSGGAWGELGLVFRAHGLGPESNLCFTEAAHLDPNNPTWPYLYGLLNLHLAPDDALPHLEAAVRLASTPSERSAARLRLAEAELDQGRTDDA